jgi:hypothetical protein
VAGFHRGAKPLVTGSSQLQIERRLKPVPHKNVGDLRIDRRPKIARDMNPTCRLSDGTATKSRARRTKAAVTRASSIMTRDLLLNQHKRCLIVLDDVLNLVSYLRTARSIALSMQTSFSGGPHRINITSWSLNQVSTYIYILRHVS